VAGRRPGKGCTERHERDQQHGRRIDTEAGAHPRVLADRVEELPENGEPERDPGTRRDATDERSAGRSDGHDLPRRESDGAQDSEVVQASPRRYSITRSVAGMSMCRTRRAAKRGARPTATTPNSTAVTTVVVETNVVTLRSGIVSSS
jgi:hypothetical protein